MTKMQKTRIRERVLAMIMTAAMLLTLSPSFLPVSAMQSTQNNNQGDGVVLRKSAKPHLDENNNPDGTVDIVIDAYTTGEVVQSTTATPSDIVLVLDVSGSMDDSQTIYNYSYTEVLGTEYETGFIFTYTYYGFRTGTTYYIKNASGEYISLRRQGSDENDFIYYSYTDTDGITQYVYPKMGANEVPSGRTREFNYPIAQFYTRSTTSSTSEKKIDTMHTSVGKFIDETLAMNQSVSDNSQKHRIAIVKYADDSYYSPSGAVTSIENAASAVEYIGNNFNSSDYNYTQLVQDFTIVDAAGDASLKASVNSLTAAGATAVDYGVTMAQAALNKRSAAEKAARNEVVIVFSDGTPTHQSNYDSSVANEAISVTYAMKNAGVSVYTLSVYEGSDGTTLGTDNTNIFMHYLSSNYPTAQSMSSPGTGNPANGYYMTPNEERNITRIFEQIIQNIGRPTMSLSKDTTVVDTLSPYFDLSNTVDPESNITIETITKTGPSSYQIDQTPDPGIKVSIEANNRQILVDGFDFDANYISDTPRDGGVYGKILRITINVKPNYDAIDNMNPKTAAIGTNLVSSPAKIVSPSQSEPVATTDSPTVTLNKVTYLVDGSSFGEGAYDAYRLPGSVSQTTFNPTKTGHTFSGWSSSDVTIAPDGTFTMPSKDIVISGSFAVNKYNISYRYSTDTLPTGVSPADPSVYNQTDVDYGTTVSLAKNPTTPAGYSFSGWGSGDVIVDGSGNFTMPARDVEFVGSFTANGNTPFKIEHYLQNIDGSYPSVPEDSYPDFGETDTTASATPNKYTGFSFDLAYTKANQQSGVSVSDAGVVSGSILGSGNRVLRIYYSRNSYDVTYKYEGQLPDNTPNAPATVTYKFGEEVTVENGVTIAGYTFRGWNSSEVASTNGEKFLMPANNVNFEGSFTANGNTKLRIEHYLQDLANDQSYTLKEGYDDAGTTDTLASATPNSYTGFVYNPTVTTEKNSSDITVTASSVSGNIKGDGSLVLKLYYTRQEFTVTYTYRDDTPSGATALPTGGTFKYGASVQVANAASATGYDFHGWLSEQVSATNNETFTMPAMNVTFSGHFVASGNTPYTVNHYLLKSNASDIYDLTNSYELKETKNLTGVTNSHVTASPHHYEGFEYSSAVTNGANSGIIDANGKTVLNLYYVRNSYTVSYVYIGIVPDGADSFLPAGETCEFGKEYTVAADIGPDRVPGYTFNGWQSADGTVTADTASFIMPAKNIELRGMFIPNTNTRYTVIHIGENLNDDNYSTTLLTDNTLTGTTGDKITTVPKGFEGFTYNPTKTGNAHTGVISGDGSTVLYVYYSRDRHTVEYEYIGIVPEDADSLPSTAEYKYGATVTVAPKASVPGYTFEGWSSFYGTITNNIPAQFDMPAFDVQLRGHFIPNTNTSYRVEHWVEQKDGTYAYKTTTTHNDGVTGQEAFALPIDIFGYTYYADHPSNVKTGIVKGDGSLVLKLHYNRDEHKVEYAFSGFVPSGAVLPATENYVLGETVTVAAISVSGYTFTGWTSYCGAVQPDDTSFVMPDRDVHLTGSFEANDTTYNIEHWLQNEDGSDSYTLKETETALDTKVGADVVASPKTYTGFTFNTEKSIDKGKVPQTGTLTLKLYYTRNTYSVSYKYYGVQPAGASDLALTHPTETGIYYGTKVEIKPIPTMEGYTFNGWNSLQVSVEPGDKNFVMPDNDVVLTGSFEPNTDTSYKVEHYIQKSGNVYELEDTDNLTGTTGTLVTASAKTISGYTFNASHPDTVKEGVVLADGGLVLKLFYTKNQPVVPPYIPQGYVEITKSVIAPEGVIASDEVFTFNIMRVVGENKVKDSTITVKAGETKNLTLSPGTYYIYEVEQAPNGYILKVNCSMTDNKVVVGDKTTSKIEFVNIYTLKESMLEKDDHFAYIVGYPDGNVHPEDNITRAEVATIFFRMMTDEARASYRATTNTFSDVKKSDWFNVAVSTLQNAKILDGYDDGTFRPNAPITRAELSKIAASFYKILPDADADFSDIFGHWAEKYIESAHSYGFIDGYPNGTFRPDRLITRAETMKIVNRSLDRLPHKDYLLKNMIIWPDNMDRKKWYYADVQEATNSHSYKRNDKHEIWIRLLPVRDWTALETIE